MAAKRTKSPSADAEPSPIDYAVGRSSLGEVLVAQGGAGVCALLLGDGPERLIRELNDLFPDRRLARDDDALAEKLAAAIDLAERPWSECSLPLEIGGTEFQRRVWRELRGIPPGVTTSYSDIAKRIGAPGALRAVAGACAANVLAIAIPCHRVLRSNGSLSGYRWGMERKRQLIERERAGR